MDVYQIWATIAVAAIIGLLLSIAYAMFTNDCANGRPFRPEPPIRVPKFDNPPPPPLPLRIENPSLNFMELIAKTQSLKIKVQKKEIKKLKEIIATLEQAKSDLIMQLNSKEKYRYTKL
jgi:hypothetical protein